MQIQKFSCHAHPLQRGAGFGLTRDPKPRNMSGPKPANRLFSTKPPYKAAHICAASPTGTPKTPPPTYPNWKNTKRSHPPLMMNDSRTANKGVNYKNTSHRFGFVRSHRPGEPQCIPATQTADANEGTGSVPCLPSRRGTPRTKILHFVERSDRLQKYKLAKTSL